MRRAFTLQMEHVPAAMRLPQKPSKPPDATRDQQRQILFTNLRRRVIVDDECPLAEEEGPYDGDLDLCQGFLVAWLEDAGMPSDTWITATAVVSCPCNACYDARQPIGGGWMYPSASYHMHWCVGSISKSVGIVQTQPELVVDRDWGPPDVLATVDDFQFAMGLVLDDALHECVMESQGDDALSLGITNRTHAMLEPRMPVHVTLENVIPSISNFLGTATIKVDVLIGGVTSSAKTITAQRVLRS